MENIVFNTEKKYGKFKPMNATNGGPWHKRHTPDQSTSNFIPYKNARIPYTRNHDTNFCSVYGGPFSVDVKVIFPRFEADVNDPDSYDFACTDESILVPLEAGTKTFYRLGHCIEHQIKKHGTIPPPDFHKWAEICEHIIRHYNEGWADGFKLGIEYWEIWNEPDLDDDDSANKRTWGGTKAQFFDLYETTAKHLKNCFPNLKIGGPALCCDMEYGEDFLKYMSERNVPVDFFSWHIYTHDVEHVISRANIAHNLLEKYGYKNSENICNEWNYIDDWLPSEKFINSLIQIGNHKGAAFVLSVIEECQKSCVDMLMYYDTRPGSFCGAFDYYTGRIKKPYYALYWYGMFYDCDYEIRCENQPKNIYTLAGILPNGKVIATVTYYNNDDTTPDKTVKLDFKRNSKYEVHIVDKDNMDKVIENVENLEFTLKVDTMLLIKEI